MINDLSEPLTKRLKKLARDSQNAAMNVLSVFSGTRRIAKSRDKFATELTRLIEQVGTTARAWQEIEQLLFFLEAKASEINETDFVQMVEGMADAAMISQSMGEGFRLLQTDCALRMLKLEPGLIPYAVKEVSTYEGGTEQLLQFKAAIEKLLELK